MSTAQHPQLHRGWRDSLKVTNETGYDTRALRRVIVGAVRAACLQVRGAVRVVYTSSARSPSFHGGSAAFGRVVRREDGSFRTLQGLTMVLTLPRDPALFDLGEFARTAYHEALHWKGVGHDDMTQAQRECTGPTPAWAEGVSVSFAPPKKQDAGEAAGRRLAHAQAMLAKAKTRAKRAATIERKWKRKVDGMIRAAARRAIKGVTS